MRPPENPISKRVTMTISGLLNKWYWGHWISTYKRMKLDSSCVSLNILAMQPVLLPCWGRETNPQPHQMLSTASSPIPPGSLAGGTWATMEPILQPCPTVKHSFWPHIIREPEQWPWAASEPSLLYQQDIEPSLQPSLIAKHSLYPCPGRAFR